MRLRRFFLMAALAMGASSWSFGADARTERPSANPAVRHRFVSLLTAAKVKKSEKTVSIVQAGNLRAFGGRIVLSVINP